MIKIKFSGEILVTHAQYKNMKDFIEDHVAQSVMSVMQQKMAEKFLIRMTNVGEQPLKLRVATRDAIHYENDQKKAKKLIKLSASSDHQNT